MERRSIAKDHFKRLYESLASKKQNLNKLGMTKNSVHHLYGFHTTVTEGVCEKLLGKGNTVIIREGGNNVPWRFQNKGRFFLQFLHLVYSLIKYQIFVMMLYTSKFTDHFLLFQSF